MADLVEVRFYPPDMVQRMERYPARLADEAEKTMQQAMYHVVGSVPGYPPAVPESRYVRTMTLGRSLGTGGSGKAEIFEVRPIGRAGFEGRVGTKVVYAQWVIGSETQRPLFKSRGWWTMRTVAERAQRGIVRLYEGMMSRMASWLGGMG